MRQGVATMVEQAETAVEVLAAAREIAALRRSGEDVSELIEALRPKTTRKISPFLRQAAAARVETLQLLSDESEAPDADAALGAAKVWVQSGSDAQLDEVAWEVERAVVAELSREISAFASSASAAQHLVDSAAAFEMPPEFDSLAEFEKKLDRKNPRRRSLRRVAALSRYRLIDATLDRAVADAAEAGGDVLAALASVLPPPAARPKNAAAEKRREEQAAENVRVQERQVPQESEEAPAEEKPTKTVPAEEAPAEETPAETASAKEAPAEEAPAEAASAEEARAEAASAEEARAEEASTGEVAPATADTPTVDTPTAEQAPEVEKPPVEGAPTRVAAPANEAHLAVKAPTFDLSTLNGRVAAGLSERVMAAAFRWTKRLSADAKAHEHPLAARARNFWPHDVRVRADLAAPAAWRGHEVGVTVHDPRRLLSTDFLSGTVFLDPEDFLALVDVVLKLRDRHKLTGRVELQRNGLIQYIAGSSPHAAQPVDASENGKPASKKDPTVALFESGMRGDSELLYGDAVTGDFVRELCERNAALSLSLRSIEKRTALVLAWVRPRQRRPHKR